MKCETSFILGRVASLILFLLSSVFAANLLVFNLFLLFILFATVSSLSDNIQCPFLSIILVMVFYVKHFSQQDVVL